MKGALQKLNKENEEKGARIKHQTKQIAYNNYHMRLRTKVDQIMKNKSPTVVKALMKNRKQRTHPWTYVRRENSILYG